MIVRLQMARSTPSVAPGLAVVLIVVLSGIVVVLGSLLAYDYREETGYWKVKWAEARAFLPLLMADVQKWRSTHNDEDLLELNGMTLAELKSILPSTAERPGGFNDTEITLRVSRIDDTAAIEFSVGAAKDLERRSLWLGCNSYRMWCDQDGNMNPEAGGPRGIVPFW